ncbi:hypothetical protein ACIGQE_27490 [Streptomyces sp. NPDC053429]|uniref:hypothetical protein n=1 Tax=Streptomyces sp. NPDC053429 TaxID=3365702 RepID=UPI0037D93BC5
MKTSPSSNHGVLARGITPEAIAGERRRRPVLRAESEHRGLLREWKPVPDDALKAGQSLGETGPRAGLWLTGRLVVALPETLWALLTRGVYWTNQPPRPPPGVDGPMQARARRRALHQHRPRPSKNAPGTLHITTTGDVVRAGLHRVVGE